MYYDSLDICEAYYIYASHYHEGQFSQLYEIFGRLNNLNFKPRLSLKDEYDLTENGQSIYDNLVAKKYLQTF